MTIEDYHLDLPDIDHSIHLDNMGHHLQTTVNYYADPGDGSPPTPVYVGRHAPPHPFQDIHTTPAKTPPPSPSTQVTNKRPTISVPVTVTDVTGNESAFSLDVHGFTYHRHESGEAAAGGGFHDETALKARYYPECEELLKTLYAAPSRHPAGVSLTPAAQAPPAPSHSTTKSVAGRRSGNLPSTPPFPIPIPN